MITLLVVSTLAYIAGANHEKIKEFIGEVLTDDNKDKD